MFGFKELITLRIFQIKAIVTHRHGDYKYFWLLHGSFFLSEERASISYFNFNIGAGKLQEKMKKPERFAAVWFFSKELEISG